jgi:hypothetical protein
MIDYLGLGELSISMIHLCHDSLTKSQDDVEGNIRVVMCVRGFGVRLETWGGSRGVSALGLVCLPGGKKMWKVLVTGKRGTSGARFVGVLARNAGEAGVYDDGRIIPHALGKMMQTPIQFVRGKPNTRRTPALWGEVDASRLFFIQNDILLVTLDTSKNPGIFSVYCVRTGRRIKISDLCPTHEYHLNLELYTVNQGFTLLNE